PTIAAAPPPQPIAAANEGTVAVPADADPLRYPLPPPRETDSAAPVAATARVPINPAIQVSAAQLQQNVLLASYNAPMVQTPPSTTSMPAIVPPQQVSSTWRSPQITSVATSPTYSSPSGTMLPLGG